MLLNTPPEESIDDPIEWIFHMDPCWDVERIKAERDILRDAAAPDPGEPPPGPSDLPSDATPEQCETYARLRDAHKGALEARAAASNTHPVTRWRSGETAYSLAATLTVPSELRNLSIGDACTISEYWLPGVEPTRFVLRPISALAWRRINDLLHDGPAWVVETCRAVIDHVLTPDGNGNTKRIDPPRDADGRIAMSWIDWLDRQPRCAQLLDHLAPEASGLRFREDARGKL